MFSFAGSILYVSDVSSPSKTSHSLHNTDAIFRHRSLCVGGERCKGTLGGAHGMTRIAIYTAQAILHCPCTFPNRQPLLRARMSRRNSHEHVPWDPVFTLDCPSARGRKPAAPMGRSTLELCRHPLPGVLNRSDEHHPISCFSFYGQDNSIMPPSNFFSGRNGLRASIRK